jgi:hypothetical protein
METEWIMDESSFAAACRAVQQTGRADQGVGTLGEKTLHAVLKRMIEPDMSRHEVKLGRYTADVFNERGVFEVQTRSRHKLKPKLTALLPYYPVTVVIPVVETKWLLTMDPETGELKDRRKSPKRGKVAGLLPELVYLKPLLKDQNLSFLLVRLEGEELRLPVAGKRRPVTPLEFAPTRFLGTVTLRTAADYAALLPADLPETFTARTLAKALGLPAGQSSAAANVLCYMGAIRRTGAQGKAYLYSTI